MNAATAAKRLERGRLRLRQVLSTYLLHEAVHYGLAERLLDDWEETPIWCPDCGKRRLFGSIEGMMGATFTLSRSFRPSAPIPATPAPCGPSSERRKRRQGR